MSELRYFVRICVHVLITATADPEEPRATLGFGVYIPALTLPIFRYIFSSKSSDTLPASTLSNT